MLLCVKKKRETNRQRDRAKTIGLPPNLVGWALIIQFLPEKEKRRRDIMMSAEEQTGFRTSPWTEKSRYETRGAKMALDHSLEFLRRP